VVLCLVASLLAASSRQAARADPPTLTRIHVAMSSSSDWAKLSLPGTTVLAAHASTVSTGARLDYDDSSFTLRGPVPSSGVVDAVVLVPVDVAPVLRLEKGFDGSAQTIVDRTIASPQTIADIVDDARSGTGPYAVVTPIDRSALVGAGFNPARIDDRRLVLGFYYPWWTASSFRHGYWVDRPTTDPATDTAAGVSGQVDLASQHGIDGFVVSWDGASPHPQRFDLVLAAAQRRPGFVVAPYLEVDEIHQEQGPGPGPILHQLMAALSRAGSPAFLHRGGRPVVFVFGARHVAAQEWAAVRRKLAAAGQDPFLVGDDPEAESSFEGFHYYNPNLMTPSQLSATYLASLASLRLGADVDSRQTRRLWAATVSPGENNRAEKFWSPTVRSRQGGASFDQTWGAALASLPDWVLVTSWNEWFEDTAVAPGTGTGNRALTQTQSWSAQFHHTS
jgi:hypothetical protein